MPTPLARVARFCGALLSLALIGPNIARAQAPAGTHFLYLVRHGDYDFDPAVDAAVGNGLNNLGREQAALVAGRLADLPVRFDSVITSQFTRARETGDIVASKLRIAARRDASLNETRPPGEGVSAPFVTPGAEDQLKEAWNRYAKATPGATRNDLLVCHGNVIRWFICMALGVDTRQWTRLDIGNTSISVIEITPGGPPRLVTFNDVSHLPLGKQSWDPWVPDWVAPPAARTAPAAKSK